jgi:hypothetical protein
MPPVFSTIRPTTIVGPDHIMTLEQSIDLTAINEDTYPETLDSLETEALIARSRYDDLRSPELGH